MNDNLIDHPLVRASATCPICEGPKDSGLVICWPCYRKTNMRCGNQDVELLLDKSERLLKLSEVKP